MFVDTVTKHRSNPKHSVGDSFVLAKIEIILPIPSFGIFDIRMSGSFRLSPGRSPEKRYAHVCNLLISPTPSEFITSEAKSDSTHCQPKPGTHSQSGESAIANSPSVESELFETINCNTQLVCPTCFGTMTAANVLDFPTLVVNKKSLVSLI